MKENAELSQLLEFINQCPFGLVKAERDGTILLMNAEGTQMLLPLAMERQLGMSNILEVIEAFDQPFAQDIQAFQATYGRICSNRRLKVQFSSVDRVQYLSFTIIRVNEDILQYSFKDVTDILAAEKRLYEVTESTALQAGKLEMSSGILHDIGNAVTAFGAEVARLQGSLQWRELSDLQKLLKLFKSKEAQLDQALGAGKGKALQSFLNALHSSLAERKETYAQTAEQLHSTTSHIQDVLSIQAHYVRGKVKNKRTPLSLRGVLEDALAIQGRGIEKRKIQVSKAYALDLPEISGDKTRLIQVLVNLLKNATEAFDEVEDDREKLLALRLDYSEDQQQIELRIEDNAIGFEEKLAETLFQKGRSTKDSGSGFGLYNCMQIVETHHGSISLSSPGPGKGAVACLRFPFASSPKPKVGVEANMA